MVRMMVLTFALVALGVFVAVRFCKALIDAPSAFFMAMAVGFSALGLWWAGESALWAPTVAGFAHGWYRVEEVLVFVRDWVKLIPLRPQRPR